MNRLLHLLFVTLLFTCFIVNPGRAQNTITIAKPFTDTLKCSDSVYNLSFQASGTYSPGNIFNVELSDRFGNFFTGNPPIGSATFSFIGTQNVNITYAIPANLPISGLSEIGYRIRVTASAPLTISDTTKTIRISKVPPVPVLSPNHSPYCEQDTIFLQVMNPQSGVTYEWNGPAVIAIFGQKTSLTKINFPADSAYIGVHTLYTTNYGCALPVPPIPITISVKPRPSKPSATSNSPICEGKDLEFSGTSTDAGVNYGWQGPNLVASGQTLEVKNITTSKAGIYTLQTELNGCLSPKDTVEVNVLRKPDVSIETNSPVCAGQTINIAANDADSNTAFSWEGPNGFTSTNEKDVIGDAAQRHSGMYRVIATNQGCTDTDAVNVQVKPMPDKPMVSADTIVTCINSTTTLSISNPDTNNTYRWTGPENFSADASSTTLQQPTMANAGNYVITADKQGCTLADSLFLITKPTPSVEAKAVTSVEVGQQLQLSANSNLPGTNYAWYGPNDFSSILQNPVLENVQENANGKYWVVGNFDGCDGTDTVDIYVYPRGSFLTLYPNPNNGNFTVKWTTTDTEKTLEIAIINSVGQIVHTTKASTENLVLNKSFSLRHLSPGVYIFEADAESRKFKRKFTVIQ